MKNITRSLPAFKAKVAKFILAHKVVSGGIALVLAYTTYSLFSTPNTSLPTYTFAAATRETVSETVSGSGQVGSTNQIDIKAKTSGDITYLGVRSGERVTKGQLLLRLDATDALRAVRTAENNLETAKLSYADLVEPADELTMSQAQGAVEQADQALKTATYNLEKSYDDSYSTVVDTFLQLPAIMESLDDIIYGNDVQSYATNISAYAVMTQNVEDTTDIFVHNVETSYKAARDLYTKNLTDYQGTSRTADKQSIVTLTNETYTTVKSVSDAIKNLRNFIDFTSDSLTRRGLNIPTILTTHKTSLSTYTSQTTSSLSSLLAATNAIRSATDSLANATRSLSEKKLSLQKTITGATELEKRNQLLTIDDRQNTLKTAQETLYDHSVYAPMDGTIGSVSVKNYDSISSGTSLMTFLADGMQIELSLNEIDAAKVKQGQLATVTFDAVDGLAIAGTVAEVDTLGTVSQGVVTYKVVISLPGQDARLKPGMSASVSIITRSAVDALTVSSSAVKSRGNSYYLETLPSVTSTGTISSTETPTEIPIEIGLVGDTTTQIISGINEGQLYIARTTTAAATKTTSAPSILNAAGGSTRGLR